MNIGIKDLVSGNYVEFASYRQGYFYYNVIVQCSDANNMSVPEKYQFQIPINDIGTATLKNKDKAITFMRWIRKSLEEKTLIKLTNEKEWT
jgi:hypothetical protein